MSDGIDSEATGDAPAAQRVSSVRSVVKAFTIIESLAQEGQLGISEIARRTNLNKATVHRLLSTLKGLGYLRQDRRADKYRLSYKLLAISSRVTRSQDFVTVARPVMERLAAEFQETVQLAVLDGANTIHIDHVPASRSLSFTVHIGSQEPAHTNALGKALLAWLSDDEFDAIFGDQDSLPPYTDSTIQSVEALRNVLRNVRLTGIAYDTEEHEVGLCCLGTPILDSDDVALAAISISAPCARLRGETLRRAQTRLLEASKEISAHLTAAEPNAEQVR